MEPKTLSMWALLFKTMNSKMANANEFGALDQLKIIIGRHKKANFESLRNKNLIAFKL